MSQGSLFTQDYLLRGIVEDAAWASVSDSEFAAFDAACRRCFASFNVAGAYNEAQTEDELIYPILDALDWPRTRWLAQARADAKGRGNVPDMLLFPDDEAKTLATKTASDQGRYRHGIALAENKAWNLPLDREPKGTGPRDEVPSTQILRYLSAAEIQSERRVMWGILTNGRHWRLYWQGARSRTEDFVEIDLPLILGIPGVAGDLFSPKPDQYAHWLKVFYLLFRRSAFLPGPDKRSFHQAALAEGRRWESQVAKNLSELVFGRVFGDLVLGLAQADPKRPADPDRMYFAEVRESALILLYRLLFVLYAEDRNLLPVRSKKYDDYALLTMREDISKRIDDSDTFSATQTRLWGNLKQLFHAIDKGDTAIEVPPYNGGLFDAQHAGLLDRAALSDAVFAPILDALSRIDLDGKRLWINYRDLSVQQLGSIYERLLEYDVALVDGRIEIVPNIFARKGSGSYYTPDELVSLIIERTLGPLLEERYRAFEDAAEKLAKDRRPKDQRLRELVALDPAMRILELKICDPAMGSGHFLVALVDYLADRVLQAMTDARATVGWADADLPYTSPLGQALLDIRTQIRSQAKVGGWAVAESQLEDRLLVRRMILKRCVYGVDRNPMAVELAKVALWLHTFTVGAPLSFLDHHLRCGNSLFGELVRPVEDEIHKRGGMYLLPTLRQAQRSASSMAKIERLTDADLAEVRTSASTFADVEASTAPLASFLSFVHALRWLDRKDATGKKAIESFYDGAYGDPIALAQGTAMPKAPNGNGNGRREVFDAFVDILDAARTIAAEERFLHWQVAFPGVWDDWSSNTPDGGFDAVIGNPPWDRMKLQQVEWFAARRPQIALAQRASDRKKMVTALEKTGDPLWHDYQKASARAEAAVRVARDIGHFPLLSGGDTNLYSLFVEKALALLEPAGLVGLLTPSGIASDKGASAFFRSISTGGRLNALLDFENRRPHDESFFPDVDSRFKFLALIAGAPNRKFDAALCGFYLNSSADLANPARCFPLKPADFKAVNPNTGTAPVFRTRRDADLTTAIYARVPVLVDRSGPEPVATFPVEYLRMLDMTNDSHLFRTPEQLAKDGFYKVAGNRFKKGAVECLPLYEGKMVQAYDHRAANIVVNLANLNRPAQQEPASIAESADPNWFPSPQYFVETTEVVWASKVAWAIGYKDVTAPTNVRTMISAAIPKGPTGNTIPVLMPGSTAKAAKAFAEWGPLLLGNINSVCFDFVARQKVQGQHLNWYIVEQLPVLPESAYERKFGKKTARDIVRAEVLKLTYVSNDMAPFAKDMGYSGKPFAWDPDARRHGRAKLDALYFHLYGLDLDEVRYVLSTFPIVKREDIAAFGKYLTEDLVLGYFRALAAGDADSTIVP